MSQVATDNRERDKNLSMFWALDPSLPRIAAQAAVEFNWLIQVQDGQQVINLSHKSIENLLMYLSESVIDTQIYSDNLENKGFNDSLGLNLFAKAYNKADKSHPISTRKELNKVVSFFSELLQKVQRDEDVKEDNLKIMMKFCIYLSDFSATYRRMVYQNQSDHPYRK